MGADKISLQRTRPKSQSQLQKSHTNTNCQNNVVMDQLQVIGTIPQSTRGSTREEAKEPNKLGKFLRIDQIVRLATADCPPKAGWTVWTGRRGLSAVQKSSPTAKTRLYVNGPRNGPQSPSRTVRQPRTVCQARADGPWMNYAENSELTRTPPQSLHWISQTAEAIEARFGGVDMRY
jgi:hypothetical protein